MHCENITLMPETNLFAMTSLNVTADNPRALSLEGCVENEDPKTKTEDRRPTGLKRRPCGLKRGPTGLKRRPTGLKPFFLQGKAKL